ncbi:MAG: DUF2461 domain-containing protein [Bacteroidales bacterium]
MKNTEIIQNTPRIMKEMFKFLRSLASHNDREWFQEHKEEYDTLRKVFEFMTQELIEGIATFDERVKGLQAKDCIFRIYRDTRFSNDKTPYKTHFGAWITKGGKKSEYPGYYLHIEPGNCVLAAGVWHPDPKLLKMFRKEIFENIDEFKEIVEERRFEDLFHGVQGSSLKTMPKGFPKDFSDGHFLMLKDYFVEKTLNDDFFDEEWVAKSVRILSVAYPFNQFLDHVVQDFTEFDS